jgi:hypothetical protein
MGCGTGYSGRSGESKGGDDSVGSDLKWQCGRLFIEKIDASRRDSIGRSVEDFILPSGMAAAIQKPFDS